MSMITRRVKCRKCGKIASLTYPKGMSDVGVEVLSLCKICRAKELQKIKDNNNNSTL